MICLAVLLSLYCFYLYRRYFLLNHPESIKRLVITELGWCHVQLKNTQIFKADIDSDSILCEHLVILNLNRKKSEEPTILIQCLNYFKIYSIFLTAGRIGNNKFREIKRYLRLLN